jgi:hypothetical protein
MSQITLMLSSFLFGCGLTNGIYGIYFYFLKARLENTSTPPPQKKLTSLYTYLCEN